ncbi:MAG TPA: signal peptide peptidase SppA [Dehalococcoidia bacterium]|nr:signal peptide peptidase SppA [Dehalococcoidia bacterium]
MADLINNSLRMLAETPWLLEPSVLDAMTRRAIVGAAAIEAAPIAARPMARQGSVAVLPLYGVLRQRGPTLTDRLFEGGGTSTDAFAAAFRRMMEDSTVSALVIDIDSPGGSVFGTPELADEILKARGTKPIIAVANSLAASAAYWIASATDEIVATPSSMVGSIGVYTVHMDFSKMDERVGVKFTYVSAGKYKVEGNEDEPLGEEARAAIQEQIDEYYSSFVSAVAKGRGVPVSTVRSGYGEGRILTAKQALKLGMIDRIGTLDATLARFGASMDGAVRIEEPLEPDIQAEDEAEIEASEDDAPPEGKGDSLDIRRRRLELAR